MAIQSSLYTTDGTTRTYPSTKHIATKQHCSVFAKRVVDSAWEILNINLYSLVNNSIIFEDALLTYLYSNIEIRVADTQDELSTSPSDLSIVASNMDDIILIANDINNIDTVAQNIGSVSTVSGSVANVNTVASSISNVNTVGGSIVNVNAVALNAANINVVASDLLEPVSEIDTVATSIANVNAVGSAITNVNTVATNITNVNSVANTIVPNIAEILLADDNAVIATAQAAIATTKATEAAASAASIDPLTLVHKDSSTGAAYMPAGTTAQRPVSPVNGYMRYNSNLLAMEAYVNGAWGSVGGGATGGGATGGGTDKVFNENGYVVTANYTIPAGKSAVTVGDASGNVTINSGVTVTLDSNSRWVVL
jgi:hypothetical protein